MRLLLDTHILLWAVESPENLPEQTRRLLDDFDNEVYFSAASLWEIAIKAGQGRKDFTLNPKVLQRTLQDYGYTELTIIGDHAVAVQSLPPIHKDPFDRLLLAQATVEGITLLTADQTIARYGGPVMLMK